MCGLNEKRHLKFLVHCLTFSITKESKNRGPGNRQMRIGRSKRKV